jgi:hypothetical protein
VFILSSRHRVLQEPKAGFHGQLGRHIQVPLGFMDAAVPQVGRQVREEPLHVLALAVPTHQSIQRERVPIMPMSA